MKKIQRVDRGKDPTGQAEQWTLPVNRTEGEVVEIPTQNHSNWVYWLNLFEQFGSQLDDL